MIVKVPISVAIITHNEAERIRECLQSVIWADEIVVIDAESTDATVPICREYAAAVHVRPWPGFARQKQFAVDQCQHEWVLSLDADERVLPDLRDAVATAINAPDGCDGYRIARRSYFLHRWIRHSGWYPGYQVRMFKKAKTQVSQSRVHEGFLVDGPIGVLRGDIEHDSHPSLASSIEKLNRYSSLEALDRLERKRVRWFDFMAHPISAFWRKYVAQTGFRDGVPGLLLAWVSALLNMVMYMKLWKLQRSSAAEVQRNREMHW
jgi:glycosyltransferase involved in cell wall biosynthesis